MARKEQITITLDPELTARLRLIAKKRGASLSSVIESYLQSVDLLAGKTDIKRVLDILTEIKEQLGDRSDLEASDTAASEESSSE